MSRDTSQPLPTGTITFLFTDIEGSTTLVQTLGTAAFSEVLEEHGRTLKEVFLSHDGVVVGTEGDSFFCVFRLPTEAVAAAVAGEQALAARAWPHGAVVRVRMGMHTGEGALGGRDSGGDYVGLDVHRAARVASSGHGGQVLLSETTQALVRDRLPTGVTLVDLGMHRFKDLGRPERVWQLAIPGLPASFPRIKSLDRTPNNLPVQLTSFIGRENEIREGVRLLGESRLLTLTGPGGTGKTRLSLQIAAAATDSFPDGVYFAALAAIVDPDLVVPTIAHELGLQLDGQRAPMDRLCDHLGEKHVLIVLDNFEQILPAAPQLTEILRRAPNAKLLCSSRAPLRLYGEQELPVPPLGLPDPRALPDLEGLSQFEAVRLFIERARASKPAFAVTNENAPAVAGICARLDGLPLAIELAASRIRVLSPEAIFARLDKSLALLAGGSRDLPARQQTLRGAIAWSYDLLDEQTRRLFRVLSWFAGGGTMTEIEAVCGAICGDLTVVVDGLGLLVEHSLVRQREEEGEPRFFMLQTVREFGLEKLAESPDADAARRRHAEIYLGLARQAAPHFTKADRKTWLDRLELEVDNFRAAIEWAIASGMSDLAMSLCSSYWRIWQARGYLLEARGVVEKVLAMPTPPGSPEPPALVEALEAAGGLAYWGGDLPAARRFYTRALEMCRRTGDQRAVANACYNLSFSMVVGQDIDAEGSKRLLEEALAIYRSLGDRAGIAKSLWAHSQLPNLHGDPAAALSGLEESVSMFRSLDDPFGLGWALHSLAWTYLGLKRLDEARAAIDEALRIFQQARDLSGITLVLDDFAQLDAAAGRPERAMRLSGAAAALKAASGTELASWVKTMFAEFEAAKTLSEEAARAAFEQGMKMSCDEAIAYALSPHEDPAGG